MSSVKSKENGKAVLAFPGRLKSTDPCVVSYGCADAGDVGRGAVLSGQVFRVFFDQGLVDRAVAAPAVEAEHVAVAGRFGKRRAESGRGCELIVEHSSEVWGRAVQEAVALVDQETITKNAIQRILFKIFVRYSCRHFKSTLRKRCGGTTHFQVRLVRFPQCGFSEFQDVSH
jgi:hypothetical protein